VLHRNILNNEVTESHIPRFAVMDRPYLAFAANALCKTCCNYPLMEGL